VEEEGAPVERAAGGGRWDACHRRPPPTSNRILTEVSASTLSPYTPPRHGRSAPLLLRADRRARRRCWKMLGTPVVGGEAPLAWRPHCSHVAVGLWPLLLPPSRPGSATGHDLPHLTPALPPKLKATLLQPKLDAPISRNVSGDCWFTTYLLALSVIYPFDKFSFGCKCHKIFMLKRKLSIWIQQSSNLITSSGVDVLLLNRL
jgi:hypothetical protein